MAINTKLDIDRCYPVTVTKKTTSFRFKAPLANGKTEQMWIHIDDLTHRHLDGVYNMAYGLAGDEERVNDGTAVTLDDPSMAFSTIMRCGLDFLKAKPNAFLGIIGKDHQRTLLFHRIIRSNFEYLEEYFTIIGVKFYARLRRHTGKTEQDNDFEVDMSDLQVREKRLEKNHLLDSDNLYNYFIFKPKSPPTVISI